MSKLIFSLIRINVLVTVNDIKIAIMKSIKLIYIELMTLLEENLMQAWILSLW